MAAVDIDDMAGGWSKDGGVQDQIDQTVADAVAAARERLNAGDARETCEACGEVIPEARRRALAGVRFCVPCQEAIDDDQRPGSGFNRRASKDSQLR